MGREASRRLRRSPRGLAGPGNRARRTGTLRAVLVGMLGGAPGDAGAIQSRIRRHLRLLVRTSTEAETALVILETRYAETVDGYRIAYQTLGEGPMDVMTVGTYFSNLEHDWTNPTFASESRMLAELGRLIHFDARGTGLSTALRDERLPSLEERIDDLRAVLDAAESEGAVLVAGADGGPLCCLHAATFPERTRGLILCNTAPRMAWAPDYPWGQTPEEFEVDLEATKTRWGTRELAAEIVRDTTPARVNDEALVEWWAESMRLSATPSAAASLLRMHYDMDVRDVLSAIHVPTLVLAGDPIAEESEAMARRIPGATFTHVRTPARYVVADPAPFHAEIRRFVFASETRSPTSIAFWRRSCSPTSSAPPRSRPNLATENGMTSSSATTTSSGVA
jgi:pimeloyl-ACP methyl ester carboxylesterase